MEAVQHGVLVTIDAMEAALRAERIRETGGPEDPAWKRPVMRAQELQDYYAVLGQDWSLSSLYQQLNRLIVAGYIVAYDWPGGFTRTKVACPSK